MAITFIATAANYAVNDSSVTTIDCDKPTGTADDDVLIAFYVASTSGIHSAESGWVQIGASMDGGSTVRMSAWYKIASSEPASYTFTAGIQNTVQCLAISTYRGVDTADPVPQSNSGVSGTAEILNTGNITTTSDGWIISAAGERDDNATVDTHTTSDSSDVERSDSGTGITYTRQLATYDSNRQLGTGTYSRTLTSNSGSTVGHATFIGALKAATAVQLPAQKLRVMGQAVSQSAGW